MVRTTQCNNSTIAYHSMSSLEVRRTLCTVLTTGRRFDLLTRIGGLDGGGDEGGVGGVALAGAMPTITLKGRTV